MNRKLISATLLIVGLTLPTAQAEIRPIVPPSIPATTFDITQYGAIADGKTLNTQAIQKAIDACAKSGGGHVVIPSGSFLCGPLTLVSNLDLHLDAGAVLLMSDDQTLYRREKPGFRDLIFAANCHDLSITGPGKIDGQGKIWWDAFLKIKNTPAAKDPKNHRPFMCVLRDCERVLVQGVTFTNSPSFHLVPGVCTDVSIDHCTFKAPAKAPNTDAVDPSGWHFEISNCTFDTGDDCIAVKASGESTPQRLSCEDFSIHNCTFQHGHGLSIGGQTPGGMRNMVVRDCTFEDTDAGIRMKAARGSGGLVEHLSYDNLTMNRVKVPIYITSYYPRAPENLADDPAQPVTATTPIWRDIRINNVTITNSPEAGRIIGLPAMPVQDITLTNVHISAEKGLQAYYAKDIRFVDSSLTIHKGEPLITHEATITGLKTERKP